MPPEHPSLRSERPPGDLSVVHRAGDVVVSHEPDDRPRLDDRPHLDDVEDLDTAVTAVLDAARGLLGVVVRSLSPGTDMVPSPQFKALVLLSAMGPTRIGTLAERLGVHQSTFTRTTDRMVAAGLVARAENPGNRREVIVTATSAGQAVVDGVRQRRRGEVREILSRLRPEDRLEVLRGLSTFARVAGTPSVEVLAPLGG